MLVKHTIHRDKKKIGQIEEVSARYGERLIAGGTAVRVEQGGQTAAASARAAQTAAGTAEAAQSGAAQAESADTGKPGKAAGKK